MDSLEATDRASAAVATNPRVSLDNIRAEINTVNYISGGIISGDEADNTFTICMIKMQNGFIVIGKSAPASPENFNEELGRKFAYENAVRELWPLMGFALRDRLAKR